MNGATFIKPMLTELKLYGGRIIYVAWSDVMTANQHRVEPYVSAVYVTAGKVNRMTAGCHT